MNRDFLQEVIEALLWTSRALEIAHDRAVDYGEISTKLGVPDNNRAQFQAMVRSRMRENIKLLRQAQEYSLITEQDLKLYLHPKWMEE